MFAQNFDLCLLSFIHHNTNLFIVFRNAGSRKEAEDFDKLPQEESKARLRKLAAKMDKNDDATVDEDELYAWIHDHMKSLDAEEVSDRFDEIDEDRDGFVTWPEYKKESFGDGQLDEDDQVKHSS